MNAPRYFVILGAMRTGSNLLERMLTRLPGVVTHGEAFNPAFIGGPKREALPGWDLPRRDADPLGYLAAMLAEGAGALPGFRHFNGHDPAVRAHVLADPACARIVLRRDPVESYVSLKIARETDQWLLNTPRRRLVARITFDAPEFEAYRSALETYYTGLAEGMAASGLSALEISYDDLLRPETLARLAAHLGQPRPEAAPDPGIYRQNPEPLCQKVANFCEMQTYLGRAADEQTGRSPPVAVVLSRTAGLAFLPLAGGERRFALRLMHWLEQRDHGAAPLTAPQLLDPETTPFMATEDLEDLAGRAAFAVVEPPAWRLARLYHAQCFGGKSCLPHIRAAVDAACAVSGRFKPGEGDPAPHRTRLLRFLDLIADARAGRGCHPVHDGWQDQVDLLAPLRALVPDLAILPLAAPNAAVTALLDQIGTAPVGPTTLARFAAGDAALAREIVDAEAQARIEALYAADLAAFDFGKAGV
ncbi:MAG: hypothetical protein AAFR17_00735 [Pseudomonadota bacterium]